MSHHDIIDDDAQQYVPLTIKEVEAYEERLGFEPSGCCNYFCTVYDLITRRREIIGEGALALHEFMLSGLPIEFFRKYMGDRKNRPYYLSIVLPNTDVVNSIILKGLETRADRYQQLQIAIERFIVIFDEVFAVFIKDGNKKLRYYRSDTNIQKLFNSHDAYQKKIKPALQSILSSIH